MKKPLSIQIHEALGVPPSRVKEILLELAFLGHDTTPTQSPIQVWDNHKEVYIQYEHYKPLQP